MRRNQLAKLTKHTEFAYGWFGISFFHLRRVTELKSHANHFFLCFNQDSYGMAVAESENVSCSTTLPPFRKSAFSESSFFVATTASALRIETGCSAPSVSSW